MERIESRLLILPKSPDRPMPWQSPKCRRYTACENTRASRSPTPQFDGKLFESILHLEEYSRRIMIRDQPKGEFDIVVITYLTDSVSFITSVQTYMYVHIVTVVCVKLF